MATVREVNQNSMAEARKEVQGTHRYILNGNLYCILLHLQYMIWYVLLMCTYLFLLFSVLSLMLGMTPAGQLYIFLKSNNYMPRLLFSLYLVLHFSTVSNKKINSMQMEQSQWKKCAMERSANDQGVEL